MKEYKEEDVVLCTVTKIEPTVIFVKIEDDGEGTIVTSEIASGRIRNIRDYVTINKKIVCKILRIRGNNIDLSLRRVTGKEREKVLREYKEEQTSEAVLKSILKDKAKDIVDKIKKNHKISAFLEQAKKDLKLLEQYFSKEEIEKVMKVLEKRKEKEVVIKREFKLKSNASDGVEVIKRILSVEAEVKYLGSSKFTISLKSANPKEAETKLNQILEKIRKDAKANNAEFEIK